MVFLFLCIQLEHKTQWESKKRKNKKTKLRQRNAKKFSAVLSLAGKDNVIENLEADLSRYKNEIKMKRETTNLKQEQKFINISCKTSTAKRETVAVATHGKCHFGLSKAR